MKQSSGLEWDLIKSEFSGTWSQSHPPSKSQATKESGGGMKRLVGFKKTQNNCIAVHHRFMSKLLIMRLKIFTHFILRGIRIYRYN